MRHFHRLLIVSMILLATHALALIDNADRDQPLDLEADKVMVDDAKQISVYTGNVVLKQGSLVIHADKLIVKENQRGFQHSTALGNPTTFKQKRQGKDEYIEGSAQRIEYDGKLDKIELYSKAWVKRNRDIVQGDYILYDAAAEYAEVTSRVGDDSSASQGGRVHAIIQPKQKQQSDDTATHCAYQKIYALKPTD